MRTWLFICVVIFAASCRTKSPVAEQNVHTGEVQEPDKTNPQVDTRFQQKFFDALNYKSRGEWQKAHNAFLECLAIDPSSAVAHYEVSRIERQILNDPQSALVHAKAAVQQDSKNPWYHHELGDVYMSLEKFELAVKSYKQVELLNPDDPNNLYEQAGALLYAGKIKEAIDVYNAIERKHGPYEELSLEKHRLYMGLGDSESAGKELENLAEAYPQEPRYWGMVLRFYTETRNREKAEYALKKLEQSDPHSGEVHFQLSEYYAAVGDDARSYDELKKSFQTTEIGIDRKINVLLKYLTLTEYNPTYLPQAYELLALTEQIHPQEAKAYSIYGDFLFRDGKDEEALIKYLRAVELDPSHNVIWMRLLELELSQRKFDALIKDSDRAIELFPQTPEFYLYNGIAHQQLENYQQAIEPLTIGKELVIDNMPLLIQFYNTLATVHNSAGNYTKSDEAFDYVLGLDPSNTLALNNYAYYLSLRKTHLDKAASMAKKANELKPGNASYQDTYAWVLYQRAEYDKALEWIDLANKQSGGNNGEILEHYGDILYRLGRSEEALTKWKEAESAGGGSSDLPAKIQSRKLTE